MLTEQKTCTHHWDIQINRGETSKGVCKICGETRDFYNVLPRIIRPPDAEMKKARSEYFRIASLVFYDTSWLEEI